MTEYADVKTTKSLGFYHKETGDAWHTECSKKWWLNPESTRIEIHTKEEAGNRKCVECHKPMASEVMSVPSVMRVQIEAAIHLIVKCCWMLTPLEVLRVMRQIDIITVEPTFEQVHFVILDMTRKGELS